MRKYLLLFGLAVLIAFTASSQDFSNKGKEFWITSGYHYSMASGTPPVMTLHITSDVNTTYQVEVFGVGVIATGNITANQVTNVNIPSTYYTTGNGLYSNKAIHVTAPLPIVVYSFITQALASAATLCLPSNVLGKQYYSANYTQISNSANSNSFITIIAVEDNTTVEIIPTGLTTNGWAANSVNTITLNKGQIYQVLGREVSSGSTSNTDLTGSSVRSIASGTGGCKRIAVFSGSGRVLIGGCSNGADNLYQQLYPVASWGRKYLTVPSADRINNYYRVMRSSATANVKLNGTLIPSTSFNNNFYEFNNSIPNMVEADTTICVVQYFPSADCVSGDPNPYDPDMVVLNPVEQNISSVTLISSNKLTHTPITPQHHIHVVIKNSGTAISSFKFDGGPIPATASWVTHPSDPTYSYLYLKNVSETYHSLKSDSGFNAVAYGYASNETYAYSAGTNVKDLYTQPGTTTPFATVAGAACSGTSFQFKISLPYKPDSIYWDLTGVPNNLPLSPYGLEKLLPLVGNTTLIPDSTTIVGGKTLYWYALPAFYTFNVPGSYDVPISAFSPTGECGTQSDYDLPLVVSDPPTASFTYTPGGCVAEAYNFTETTPQLPFPTYLYSWDFGDPGSGANNTSTSKSPSHVFSAPGSYTVKFSGTTTGGCVSSAATQTVVVPDLPTATISGTTSVCVGSSPAPQITFTGSKGTPGYTFSYNINGVPQTPVQTIGIASSVTVNAPTASAGPFVYQLTGVKNTGSTLCTTDLTAANLTATVTVNPNAGISYKSGNINQTLCVNTPITPIVYTITNGTGGNVTNLPAGVTSSYNSATNELTIAGTPTAAGTYNYLASPLGTCFDPALPPLGGTIIVSADATLTLTTPGTNTQTVCVNTNIATISYLMGGGATGVTVTGLPTGVNYLVSGNNINITGAPSGVFSTPQTYNYSIATVSTCINPPPLTGTIIVNPNTSLTLTSLPATTSQSLCVNNAISNITYQVGDGGTSATLTGTLPTGVTGVYDVPTRTFTISGTPTGVFPTPQTYNYTISTTGTCIQPTPLTGSITVNPDATLVWDNTSGATTQTICINKPLVPIRYNVGGGGTNIAMTGTFPAGVTGTYSAGVYTIQGTPTVSSATPYHYSISTTGTCLQAGPLAGDITVNPDAAIALNAASASTTQAVCINTAILPIKFDVTGNATAVNIAPALPAGLTGVYSGGTYTVSGTPSASIVATAYTITATGTCGPATATINLTVNPDATLVWDNTSGAVTQTICINKPIVPIRYNVGGGGTNIAMTGTFPAGVTGTYSAGVYTIQGTPTVSSATPYHYSISTTGTCLQAGPLAGDITVNPDAAIALNAASASTTQAVCINTAILPIKFDVTGNATAVNIAPALPAGLTGVYSGGTYTVSGTPSVSIAATAYTITATGTCGPATATINLTVNPDATLVWDNTSGAVTQTICINKPIVPIRYNVGGGGTNIAMTGTFPAGVTGTYSAGVYTIQGTPTVSSATPYHYSISTTGTCLQAGPLSGDITVNPDAAIALNAASASTTQDVCINTAILPIKFDVTGNTTAVNIAPALPAGLTGVYSGGTYTISGTATATSPATAYTITASGTCDPATATVNISVNAATAAFSYAKPLCEGNAASFTDLSTATPAIVLNNTVWDFGDGSALENHAPGSTFTHLFPGVATYTVKMYATSVSGCNSAVTQQLVTVNPVPRPGFTVDKTFYCLPNATVIFDPSPSTIADGTSLIYSWDFGDPTSGSNTSTGLNPSHTFASVGPFNVKLEAKSSVTGCLHDTVIVIKTIHPQPKASFTTNKPSLCIGDDVVFTDNSNPVEGTVNAWHWDFGDGVKNDVDNSVDHLFISADTFNVSLYITNSIGCNSDTLTKPFAVYDFPKVNAGEDRFVLEGGSVKLNPVVTGQNLQYLWSPSKYLNDPTLLQPTASLITDDITYRLTATGIGGCPRFDDVFIKVLKFPTIPNTFTPNNDGINDKWRIKYLESYPKCKIQVFTKTGQVVYNIEGYSDAKAWDGTLNGKPLPLDTYYYVIEPGNGRDPITGYITILK